MTLNPRTLALIVVAVLFAGGTAILARNWIAGERSQVAQPAPAQPTSDLQVLVAKQDLPAGLIIKDEHVRWQAWPRATLADNYIQAGEGNIADFAGAVVRRGLGAGQPITRSQVVRSGDRGFLAAVLSPGRRAVSVPISAVSGIAGFVFPGDRVDLILTHELTQSGRGARASETILENVRVLAVDQKTNDQNSAAQVAKTATLELTPKQVEQVALVQKMGTLSLSLRSLPDAKAMAGEAAGEIAPPRRGKSYTWETEVSRLLGGGGGPSKTQDVNVARGGAWSTQKFRKAIQ